MSPASQPIDHTPLKPPRATWWGEEAFHAAWQALMAKPEVVWRLDNDDLDCSPLADVLDVLSVTQRRATVAATFAVFLGCNGGQGIVHAGDRIRRMASSNIEIKHPILAAWSQENIRRSWHNGGLRLMDAIFASPGDYGHCSFSGGKAIVKQPQYSADDIEVIERFCIWLDSARGRAWFDDAVEDSKKREREYRDAERAANRNLLSVKNPI